MRILGRLGAGFNEAAGITRRKAQPSCPITFHVEPASMRPPELPGGKAPNAAAATVPPELQ